MVFGVYNYYIYYIGNEKIYLRYGRAVPETDIRGFAMDNKKLYVGLRGMECIDFEDFIKFMK